MKIYGNQKLNQIKPAFRNALETRDKSITKLVFSQAINFYRICYAFGM